MRWTIAALLLAAVAPLGATPQPAQVAAGGNVPPAPPPDRVGRVVIEGNTDAPDRLILRQLRLAPGDVLQYPAVEEAKVRLERLGFSADNTPSVEVIPSKDGGAGFVDVRIRVEARPWGWAELACEAVAAGLDLDADRVWAAAYRLRAKVAVVRESWPQGRKG